jgi:hypothetical protein
MKLQLNGKYVRAILFSLIAIVAVGTLSQFKSIELKNSEILERANKEFGALGFEVESTEVSVWWISPDGYSIINDVSPGVEAKFFNCEADNLAERKIWEDHALALSSLVDELLRKEGFALNPINSSTSTTDDRYWDYVRAYERGSTKATLSVNADCWSDGVESDAPLYYSAQFGITDEYETNYSEQSPFLIDLGLRDYIIHVEKIVDDFAWINVNARRSGHYVIAKKIDGHWVEVFAGQDVIHCELRDQIGIPVDIAPYCYDGQ